MTETKDESRARDQAALQCESINEMVDALDVDYERLRELREERRRLVDGVSEKLGFNFTDNHHKNATCPCGILIHPSYGGGLDPNQHQVEDCPFVDLAEWEYENGEELKELSEAAGDCESEDDARERIMEDPLSVQVRSDWHDPGTPGEAVEFMILLCTGGPAVRITGDLGLYNRISEPVVEYQDWFTPWERYNGDALDYDKLVRYCECFYFGD